MMARLTHNEWTRLNALALDLHRAPDVPRLLEILRGSLPGLIGRDCRLDYELEAHPSQPPCPEGVLRLGPFALRCDGTLSAAQRLILRHVAEHTAIAWDRAAPASLVTSQHPAYGTLTRRQREVLHLLLRDLSNAEIAAELHISPRTVEKHVAALCQRFAVQGRHGFTKNSFAA